MLLGKARLRQLAFVLLPVLALATWISAISTPQRVRKRKIVCKTPEIAATCYWTHGRLANYNGTPTLRLWKIGTKRILAIHSGPGFKLGDNQENENPEVPANVERAFKDFETLVYGDFEICPLEPEEPGVMQRACIESAKNLVVE